jgi:hypothetical protein
MAYQKKLINYCMKRRGRGREIINSGKTAKTKIIIS